MNTTNSFGPCYFTVQETISCPPTPMKRRNGPLSLNEKLIISNVYEFVRYESSHLSVDSSVAKCSAMTGVGKATVYKVLKEKNVGGLQPPKKSKGRKSKCKNEDIKNAIQKKISSFAFENDIPSINKVFDLIKEDPDIPSIGRSTLWRILKQLNYKEKFRDQDSSSTSDRSDKNEDSSDSSKMRDDAFQDIQNCSTYDDFEVKWSDYKNKKPKYREFDERSKNIEENCVFLKTEFVDEMKTSDDAFQDLQNFSTDNDLDYKYCVQNNCKSEISKNCEFSSEFRNFVNSTVSNNEVNKTFKFEDGNTSLKTTKIDIIYNPVKYEYSDVSFIKKEEIDNNKCG